MLNVSKLFFSVLAVAVAAIASAQQDPFDLKFAKMELLQAKPVQRDIHLTEAQRATMNKFADKHRARVKQLSDEIVAAKRDPKNLSDADKKRLIGFYNDLRHDVLTQLSAPQLKRLREITFQQAGPAPLMDPEIGRRVGLSQAQIEKIRKAFVSGNNQAQTLEKNTLNPILASYRNVKPKDEADAKRIRDEVSGKIKAAGDRIKPKMVAIQVSTRNAMLAVLTPAQKKAWAALQGAKFDFSK